MLVKIASDWSVSLEDPEDFKRFSVSVATSADELPRLRDAVSRCREPDRQGHHVGQRSVVQNCTGPHRGREMAGLRVRHDCRGEEIWLGRRSERLDQGPRCMGRNGYLIASILRNL